MVRAVEGEVNDHSFRQVVRAAAPRLVRLGMKFAF